MLRPTALSIVGLAIVPFVGCAVVLGIGYLLGNEIVILPLLLLPSLLPGLFVCVVPAAVITASSTARSDHRRSSLLRACALMSAGWALSVLLAPFGTLVFGLAAGANDSGFVSTYWPQVGYTSWLLVVLLPLSWLTCVVVHRRSSHRAATLENTL